MTRQRLLKTSFTSGELSPRMYGRDDMAAYGNGAARLRNVFIHPTGGVSRRPGLRYVDTARGLGRLVGFEFNTEQVYLLVFADQYIDVYRDGAKVAEVATPWTLSDLDQLSWTQSADTLLLVHPEHEPRQLTRTSHTDWTLATWTFVAEDSAQRIPFHKFLDPDVTLSASATTGTVTLTASADVFVAGHVGERFRLQEKQVEITAFTSATQATAVVKETLVGTGATKDWDEAAFSAVRGWPVSVAFHQDRLVIGGSRDLPNRLWLSKSSDFFNFDLGEGLDDEAIEFPIVSDQVNAIRAVFSGRHLQVFTSGAEWMVTGQPLTPENVQLHRQTCVGASVDRSLAPRDVDGATVFVARNGRELREFLFADVEQAYRATDLAMVSQHMMTGAVDLEYDPQRRMCHVVLADGTLATVTLFRAERVSGWSLATTDGTFHAVAGVGEDIYALVERGGAVFVERFDDALKTDAALTATAAPAKTDWTGYDHLEGRAVAVVADGSVRPPATVTAGAVALAQPAGSLEVGLPYTMEVEPLPPAPRSALGAAQAVAMRLVAVTFRLVDTAALRVDTGGPWLSGANLGLKVIWTLAAGTDYHREPDVWGGGFKIATANQVNAMDAVPNKFRIRDVQLELGSVATAPEQIDYATKLAQCKRYHQKGAYGVQGNAPTASTFALAATLPVEMRAAPTLALLDTSVQTRVNGSSTVTSSGSTLADSGSYTTGYFARLTGYSSLTVGDQLVVIQDDWLSLKAEL